MITETVLSGSLLAAAPLALAAGLVSFFSPCVLPLAPAYLAYVAGMSGSEVSADRDSGTAQAGVGTALAERTRRRRGTMLAGSLLFIAGFTAVFMSAGALFGGVGGLLLDHAEVITRVLGVLTIVLGLAFMGMVPALSRELRLHRRPAAGLAGAPVLGVLFGLGWTPCIGPTLAAVQTLAFTEGSAVRGALLALFYCIGLGMPFVFAAVAYSKALRVFAAAKRHHRTVMIVGGMLMVGLGLLLVTGVWTQFAAVMQGWAAGFSTVI